MSFHGVIVFTVSVLAAFVQVDFQSKSWSAFETHYRIMFNFFLVSSVYVEASAMVTLQVELGEITKNENVALNEIRHVSRAQASGFTVDLTQWIVRFCSNFRSHT
ncbi:hypothetical protein PanWU01x14_292500 [Parasponia andersonii]|uniref:Uncharacterized protein n=1 Tax=Parasponia andersonii TaxID=3476 RepID=A0A2P5AX62_PARAD|nr:hypothetical protein PanWU01x14_292500 [Parasponia andersonii]